MEIIKHHLDSSEYIKEVHKKKQIILHHTAGSHRADWTIDFWNIDRNSSGGRIRVATSYVIGGKSIVDGNTTFDGKIYEAFEDKYWAYALGVNGGTQLEKNSIQIEICNYGSLTLSKNGQFYTYVNSVVPEEDVIELSQPFKSSKYYHKYTDAQLDTLRLLILDISKRHNIDVKLGLNECIDRTVSLNPVIINDTKELQKWLNENNFVDHNLKSLKEDGVMGNSTRSAMEKALNMPFDKQHAAMMGQEGIWTHTNYRTDKSDMSPQPQLIDMLRSL